MVGIKTVLILGLIVGCVWAPGAHAQSLSAADDLETNAADVSGLALLNENLLPTNTLVPGDTMYLTCLAQDDDGFRNVRRIDFWFYFKNNNGVEDQPAVSAHIAWRRFMDPAWTVVYPESTTWKVIPELSFIDSLTNSTLPQMVSLAFTPSRIARSSATGKWTLQVDLIRASGGTRWNWLLNQECDPHVEISYLGSPGEFTAGPAGATDLPLSNPASGSLRAGIIANQEFHLKARVANMPGVSSPAETLLVDSPTPRIRYDVPGEMSGMLETVTRNLITSAPPLDRDEPREVPVQLWIDHPDTILAQQYAGDLTYTIQAVGGPGATVEDTVTLVATVTDEPLAATTALAEVSPYTVVVGTTSQPFTAFLFPDIQPGDTGVNRCLVSIPAGYSIPTVSGVRVGGSPATFADSSVAGLLDVRLGSSVTSPVLIEVDFTLDTPATADIMGQPFTILFDDSQTLIGPQGAIEGDANGLSDSDRWLVKLIPGLLASIEVNPESLTTRVDSITTFSAMAEDGLGNPISASISWRAEGAIGSVDPVSGVFTATNAGSGLVIAEIGGFADTSHVTVEPDPGIAIHTVTGPASVSQGQLDFGVQVRVENLGNDPVDIDSLQLAYTRAVPGDANTAFTTVASGSNPGTIAAGQSEWLAFDVSVADTAAAGDVEIDGSVWATDQGTAAAISDPGADTLWTLRIETPPELAEIAGTLTPNLITQGVAGQSFAVDISNSGEAGFSPGPASKLLILAPGDTLVFPYSGGTMPAGKPTAVLGGDASLTFGPTSIPAAYPTGKHPAEIYLIGLDTNGKLYTRTLALSDSVTVRASTVQVTVAATQSVSVVLPGQKEALILNLAIAHDAGNPITLQSLILSNTTIGSGTLPELDGEFDLLRLYLDDGDGRIEPGVDSLIGNTSVSGGEAPFSSLSLSIPNGAVAQLLVSTEISLAAADLDTLDLAILDPSAVLFDESVVFSNAWPVSPTGGLVVDGMAAAQILVGPHTDTNAIAGESGVLALDATLPANGYHPDTLDTIRLINAGTALPGVDIDRVHLWRDGGDGQFDGGIADDILLGEMSRQPSFWVQVGVNQPIPLTGLQLFATADIAPAATGQATLNLAIPEQPGYGVFVRSGNDGPRDSVVPSGFTVTIQTDTTAYLSVLASDQAGAVLLPGDTSAEIFRLSVVNHWSQPETLTTLTLTNRTQGSGSIGELDADWGPLTLGVGDGESVREKPGLGFAAEASFLADIVTFTDLQLEIPPQDTLTLSVWGGPSLDARDGDLLDLSLEGPGDLVFSPSISLSGSWPLDPAGSFPVDGMSAGQITLVPVPSSTFRSGTQRSLALHFVLPPNGYESDILERLNIKNLGTARADLEIERMVGWIDEGDGSFDPATDQSLGEMTFTGDRWEITGISEPVSLAGVRVFISVDIASLAGEGNTIRLALPTGSDLGIGMASGNDGPLDQQVANPFSQSISAADRITVTAVPLGSQTAYPGDPGLSLLQLSVSNSYDATKRLNSLVFTNASTGPGLQTELDGEIETLQLRADGNLNGVLDGADPLLGTAAFVNGSAVFHGLTWAIPADSLRTLFLTGNVSVAGARDGDVLAAVITDGSGLLFEDATAVVGSWPLDSGARYTVDGMLQAQITNLGAPVATVGPSDGPVLAMDFILPSNGYQTDELNGLLVANQGSAGDTEIGVLRLWLDGGDGAFAAGGDDIEISSMSWTGSGWQSPFLAVPLPRAGARFFISAEISGAPGDSTTLRLALPLGGVQTASGNDGPIDLPVENQETILLSSAPLLATLQVVEPASTIGRQFEIRMLLRNVSDEQIDNITPSSLVMAGDGVADPVTGPLPLSLSLAPGEADTIRWQCTATTPGSVKFAGSASGTGQPSGLPRNSALVQSNTHRIFVEVENLGLYSIESMPFSINRGQTDVVPLNLTLTNYGGNEASNVRLRGLRIRLEDENGQGIVPADLLSRVVVNEGTNVYLSKTTLEPSGAIIDLTLANPVMVTSSEPVTLSLQLDILTNTTVPNFRVVIPDSAQFSTEDATSGAPVNVILEEGAYPIRSGLARLNAEAVALQISPVAGASQRVGSGQTRVPVASFGLLNSGIDGLSSDVRVVSLEAKLTNANGAPVAEPSQILNRIRVLNSQQVFLDRSVDAADDTTLALLLSPLMPVPVNLPLDLTVEVDLLESAPLGTYRIELGDSARFDARDANSGQRVPALYQVEPLTGPEFTIESGAEELLVSGSALFPASAPAGQKALPAMRAVLSHPGPAGTARARLDELTVHFSDEKRDPLVPADFITRLQVLEGASVIAEVLVPPTTGSSIAVALPGMMLEPGQSFAIDIRVDLQPSAPASYVELTVSDGDILAVDANTADVLLAIPETGASLLVTSSLMQIVTPARNLVVGLESLMPAVLVRDGTETPAARITLTNSASMGSGPIRLDRIAIKAADQDGREIAVGAVANRLIVYHDGALWGTSGDLSADSTVAIITGMDTLSVEPGSPAALDLRFETQPAGTVPGLRLGLDDTGVGVVQPSDPLLLVDTQPQQGQVFPVWTQTGNFSGLSLEESYANFPNPFAAGRQFTSFVYSLRIGAQVTLRIYTSRGEPVATVVNGFYRPSGLHQDDRWDGRNGSGNTVTNGVYIAELSVQYDDGKFEKLRRKVAVLR